MSQFLDSITKKNDYATEEGSIQSIPIEAIVPDPDQVRENFEDDKIDELADSIKAKGLLNPIHVRAYGDGEYIIITGERRYRASKKAGLPTIKCIIHHEKLSEQDIHALQLIENLQRQDLSALETAKAFKKLMEKKMTKRKIAASLGISESTVIRHTAIIDKIPGDWLVEIEEKLNNASLNELYEIAKEKKRQKKASLYNKLMERAGEQSKKVVEEEEAKGKSKREAKSEFSMAEIEKAWEMLKREKKKDLANVARYISRRKLQTLIDMYDERVW